VTYESKIEKNKLSTPAAKWLTLQHTLLRSRTLIQDSREQDSISMTFWDGKQISAYQELEVGQRQQKGHGGHLGECRNGLSVDYSDGQTYRTVHFKG
jgi:hypothetical protein